MKKIIIFIFVGMFLLSLVSATTIMHPELQTVCHPSPVHINGAWNGEYEDVCEEMFVDVYETVEPEKINISVDTIETENVISHNYLYGSEGFNADNIPTSTLEDILNNIKVNPDGEINKSTYDSRMIQTINGVAYIKQGVVNSFMVIIMQRLDLIIHNIIDKNNEQDLKWNCVLNGNTLSQIKSCVGGI